MEITNKGGVVMAYILAYIIMVLIDWIKKIIRFYLKVMWIFCKIMIWMMVVPLVDIVTLSFALIAVIICKLRKKSLPHLKHTKYWVVYPSWA